MCHDPKTIAKRHFVVVPYKINEDGISVSRPTACPCSKGEKCRIFFDHWRYRKTGPKILCVVRCRTHEIGFTLYPPGFTPWGRKPWIQVTSNDGATSKNDFQETNFEAALDAKNDIFWTKDKDTDPDRKANRCTQQCHLNRAARILGFEQEPIEAFTQTLCISGQQFHEAISTLHLDLFFPSRSANKSSNDSPYNQYDMSLGGFVDNVLNAIVPNTDWLFERIAACGAAVGLWPPLHVWREHTQQLVPRPFYHAEPNVLMADP